MVRDLRGGREVRIDGCDHETAGQTDEQQRDLGASVAG
jgi:hypothetical protein